jgi:putative oxidoreductase
MLSMTKCCSEDLGKLLLRLSVGGMMLFHGISKLMHGVDFVVKQFQEHGLPGALAYTAYLGEVVAPLLILVGFLTRPAALLVAITMTVAISLVHRGDVFKLGPAGGWALELQALYLLGALALCFLGAGKYSLSRGRGAWD